MNFSHRTNWHRGHNRLTEAAELRRKSGKPIYDLTISNPTECGFTYPDDDILRAISDRTSLRYEPDPRGLQSARECVSRFYAERHAKVPTSNIFLTASTSEAYSLIFKLLCDPGNSVLVPTPSYPLFDYLAQANDVVLQTYRLFHDHGWHIDLASLRNAISPSSRAIVLISPHNPTGMFLKKADHEEIRTIALENDLALVVDEVFGEYGFDDDMNRVRTTAGSHDGLTFTLNGVSKLCGLPQMKLGWIVLSGERKMVQEAGERLEILSDTFLSANTPSQTGLSGLLSSGSDVRSQILARISGNYKTIQKSLADSPCSLLASEGGWYGILKVPRMISDEQWVVELLENCGVYVFPGYFFDFQDEGSLVLSLLPKHDIFDHALKLLLAHVEAACFPGS